MSAALPVTPALRQRIEATIDSLLALLDRLDGDENLEDGHDLETVNEDGGDINDEPHDWNELELDFRDGAVQWSDSPDIPQEGWNWHGCVSGNEPSRNSPTRAA